MSTSLISPSIGRKVWYWTRENKTGQAEDATVVFVHNDECVNLRVTDHNGDSRPVHRVVLRQPGKPVAHDVDAYCEWMPYQISQAIKHEPAVPATVKLPLSPVPPR